MRDQENVSVGGHIYQTTVHSAKNTGNLSTYTEDSATYTEASDA